MTLLDCPSVLSTRDDVMRCQRRRWHRGRHQRGGWKWTPKKVRR